MELEVNSSRSGAGCGCGGCLSTLMALTFTCGMGLGIPLIISGSHTDSDKAAVKVYQACPAVTKALGSPIERVPWSMSCGEYEGGGSHAQSDWTIKIRGPKGSASGWYSASYTGGSPWTVHAATIDLPTGEINAVNCPSSKPEPRARPDKKRDKRDKDDGGKGGKSKKGKNR